MTAKKRDDVTMTTVKRWLAVGTPLMAIDSADQPDLLGRLSAMVRAMSEASGDEQRPVVVWDCVTGCEALNDTGRRALAGIDANKLAKAQSAGPHIVLHVLRDIEERTLLVMSNAHWWWDKPPVMQAILNLRDSFKASKRALLLLVLDASLPADLQQSVSYLSDPLPDESALSETVNGVYGSALGKPMAEGERVEIARELRGASPFKAEQLSAQSLTKAGIERGRLRQNVRKQIDDTPGLSVESEGVDFDSIGGLDAVRGYLGKLFAGPRRPSLVVRIEEIEKALAGVGSESSGTSGDALGVLLTAMEDNRWGGALCYGVSGCGKSLVAKAAANQFGAKAVRFDLNACKASLVGESERQIRQAVRVLEAIGGERVYFLASMNEISSLPPELRRRFSGGVWYFDVPTREERASIWDISAKQFGIDWDGYDQGQLTGADIRDICQRAYELQTSCTDAASYHVPLCRSAPEAIGSSRQAAAGRYLDASAGGVYQERPASDAPVGGGRSFDLE